MPGIDKEARLAEVTAHIADVCAKRGIMIKTFFDDAARDDHSAKVHGHVTAPQFCASLKTKVRAGHMNTSLHSHVHGCSPTVCGRGITAGY
jgi:hypothetical protein